MVAGGFRPEIQALRAVAVAIVVVYHLWPRSLTGGYVGVDVFFVISGFLITSHLLGEIHRTGTVSLTRFWSRRIRRLLPASLLVLAVTLVSVILWVPQSMLQQSLREIGASAVYIVNWVLAGDAVDYLAAGNTHTAVQHFWSLSVEEQFYVLWPLLLVCAIWFVRLWTRINPTAAWWPTARTVISAVLAAVFVFSLAYSIYLTAYSQPSAYFNTFTRAWEFAAGALVAVAIVLWPRLRFGSERVALGVGVCGSWLGIVLIAASAFWLSDSSEFPGSVALVPVVGAILVILFGGTKGRFAPLWLMKLWPVQRLGDWSYALYLWHWPLIALYPFVFGHAFGFIGAASILALSIALAAATKFFIEDPVRSGRWWVKRRWPSFGLAVVGAFVILSITGAQSYAIDVARANAAAIAEDRADGDAPCFGARAMDPESDCQDAFNVTSPIDLTFASSDLDPDWCLALPTDDFKSCEYGDRSSPKRTLALVGDSHAAALVPAFDKYFAEAGWKVVTFMRQGCPATSTTPIDLPGREVWEQEACATWSQRVLDEIESSTEISDVVFTGFSVRYYDTAVPESGRLSSPTIAATWSRLIDAGKKVAVIRDVPNTNRVDIPDCLLTATATIAPCSFSRSAAVVGDQTTDAVAQVPGVSLIDLSDWFCDDATCYAVLGDVVVYADDNHISNTFAQTLAPFLGRKVEDAFAY